MYIVLLCKGNDTMVIHDHDCIVFLECTLLFKSLASAKQGNAFIQQVGYVTIKTFIIQMLFC